MATLPTKPTIYDVAKAAGASASTVSAALSGSWKGRRIRPETVARVKDAAASLGYALNRQARGLRQARSGLVGMILPVHDNRFFSSLSQHFATEVRRRGLCPVIVSTRREPDEEVRTVEDLLSYVVDSLFIAGATNPDALSLMCREAKLRHVFLDLPAEHSPSVVGDNQAGADRLTRRLLDLMPEVGDARRGRIHFLGGDETLYATSRRLSAFRAAVTTRVGQFDADQVVACGYGPATAAREMERLVERLGGLPAALFINSIPVFEGAMSYLVRLPPESFSETAIGCYDYDPFGAFLPFPVHMVAQNASALIARGFALLDAGVEEPVLEMVAPDLVPPRTFRMDTLGDLG